MKCPKTMIRQKLSNFLTDEDGAVTVDFVVLTAGVIALGVVAASQFVVSDDDIDEMDPNYSELDYIAQYIMEQLGIIPAPNRSVMDRLTRTIRVKTILFKVCIGFGMTVAGDLYKDEIQSAYCDLL